MRHALFSAEHKLIGVAERADSQSLILQTWGRIRLRIPYFYTDRRFFPPYYAARVVRNATLRQHPAVRAALEKIAGALDNQSMLELNGLDLS